MLIKPQTSNVAKIRVLGIGGGGGNALNSMISLSQIQGVEFVAVNTDSQALLSNAASTKIQIGDNITRGLGSGGDPEMGRQAAEESKERIKSMLDGSDMVFLAAGMGGGTGTGAAPIIAEVAKEVGALTIGVVTKPFAFEGTRRMVQAEDGIDNMKDKVDTLIVIPNQRILDVVDKKLSLLEAFKVADSVLSQGVQGISDMITLPGLINVDFADVKSIMMNAGSALMGIGTGVGENRAMTAARAAIASPLLEISMDGARGVLFNIIGGLDLTMNEVDEAAKIISAAADPDANIIFGAAIDDTMKDQMKITVIATGFDNTKQKLKEFVSPFEKPVMPQPAPSSSSSSSLNPFSPSTPASTPAQPAQATNQGTNTKQEEEDDDVFEIPAFLRQRN